MSSSASETLECVLKRKDFEHNFISRPCCNINYSQNGYKIKTKYLDFKIIDNDTIEMYYEITEHILTVKNVDVKRYNEHSFIVTVNGNELIFHHYKINFRNKLWELRCVRCNESKITLTINIISINPDRLIFDDIFARGKIDCDNNILSFRRHERIKHYKIYACNLKYCESTNTLETECVFSRYKPSSQYEIVRVKKLSKKINSQYIVNKESFTVDYNIMSMKVKKNNKRTHMSSEQTFNTTNELQQTKKTRTEDYSIIKNIEEQEESEKTSSCSEASSSSDYNAVTTNAPKKMIFKSTIGKIDYKNCKFNRINNDLEIKIIFVDENQITLNYNHIIKDVKPSSKYTCIYDEQNNEYIVEIRNP